MTPPTAVQAESGQVDHAQDQKKRTARQVKQQVQEQKERRDSNGNIIKEKTAEKKKPVTSRIWAFVLRVLSKKPSFHPRGRRASYNFGDSLSRKEESAKRHWWWPNNNVKGRRVISNTLSRVASRK
ncbi:hypothetical protein Aduo_004767 [Ancylostoma duodenale]